MFYTLNTALQTLHTVKVGSTLEQKIAARNAKTVQINHHKHIIFTSSADAKTAQTMLILNVSQS